MDTYEKQMVTLQDLKQLLKSLDDIDNMAWYRIEFAADGSCILHRYPQMQPDSDLIAWGITLDELPAAIEKQRLLIESWHNGKDTQSGQIPS